MMIDPDVLIAEFGGAAAKAGIHGWPCRQRFEVLAAPHQKPVLSPGEGAAYVFCIGLVYGTSAPCGRGTVLKVIGVADGVVPSPAAVTPATTDPLAHAQDLQRERCLLFVACTRARDHLYVSYSGSPSPFLA